MKTFALLATLASTLAATAANTLAWWTFDDDPLGVTDATGNFNTLTNGGIAIVDGAASFDGTAKVFSTIRPLPVESTKAYTFECFVRPATTQNSAAGILELSPNAGSYDGGAFIFYPDGAMEHRTINNKPKWTGRKLQKNILDDQWHHLAAIFTPGGTSNVAEQVLFYVDGELQDIYTQYQDGNVYLLTYTLYIGSRGGWQHSFTGLIDDVRITEGALSTNEFLKARTAGKPVVAYYPFNTPETAFQDASGNGNHLTGNGVTFQDGYASFNGGAHTMNTINKLDLSAYKDATLEFFIRPHTNAPTTAMVMELSENIMGKNGCFFVTLNETGPGVLNGSFYPGGWHIDVSQSNQVFAGWHHVALVIDSSLPGADRSRLFIDGMQAPQNPQYKAASDVNLGNQIFYIGSRANTSYRLNADIDDIRITARALQPGSFMSARSQSPDPSGVIAYWPFDTGNPLHDATENGNELQSDGVTFTTDRTALLSGSQRKFSTIGTLPLYGRDALTVEYFMRTTDAGTLALLMELGPNFNNAQGRFAIVENQYVTGDVQDGRMDAGFHMLVNYNIKKTNAVADGKWHHYALVYDSSRLDSGIVRFFKDGVPQPTEGAHNKVYKTGFRSERLYIGSRSDSGYWFVGELDDIKITGRALEPSEFLKKRSSPPGVCIIIR